MAVMEDNTMNKIDEYLYKYGLHDCVIDKIYVQNDLLFFSFSTGVYNLDEKGTETTKTAECIMRLEIDGLNVKRMWEHIEILKIYKNKISEINFEVFAEEVNNYKFEIIDNYLSYFGCSILIEGYSLKHKYQIKISEVIKIEFVF